MRKVCDEARLWRLLSAYTSARSTPRRFSALMVLMSSIQVAGSARKIVRI